MNVEYLQLRLEGASARIVVDEVVGIDPEGNEQRGQLVAGEMDYGRRAVLVTGLERDEPVFVLRGRDAIAMALLNQYRTMTEGLFDGDRALQLEADVQAFIDWRRAHLVRDPD